MDVSFFDFVSFIILCILLIGVGIFLQHISTLCGALTAKGATLLCPIVSPFWKLITNISEFLPTLPLVGNLLTLFFAIAAAGFSWWRIGYLVNFMGWEPAMEMLMEGSAMGYLMTVFGGEAFEGFSDISQIFTAGLTALLMATLAHAFLSVLVDQGEHVPFVMQLLYGAIFAIFCICLGTYLPGDLGLSVPEQWWTMAQIQLPEISLGTDLLAETMVLLQLYLDLMMRALVIYLVCMGVLTMITNLLSTFGCGLIALAVLFIASGILEIAAPGMTISSEAELTFGLILLLITEIFFLNMPSNEELSEDSSISSVLAEDPTEDYFIHPYAAIFGGFMGGPFVWMAGLGIYLLFTNGFQLDVLGMILWVLFLYVIASIPAIFSLWRKENLSSDGMASYMVISILWIPLLMLILFVFVK